MAKSDSERPEAKVQRFQDALNNLIQRLQQDRYVLAAVLVGSITKETIWRKEKIGLWIIEADGVTKRLRSDGKEERIFRILAEDGINIYAEIIPRSRFKQMVEGCSRTAFSCNFFATRTLVYCDDPSIEGWFEEANEVAKKDQEKELLAATTWAIHAHRHAEKLLSIKEDLELARQEVFGAAHSLAAIEIILQGEVYEQEIIYKAIEINPGLFQVIYLDLLAGPGSAELLRGALDRINDYLEEHGDRHLKPLLHYLAKQKRVVPLSEISDHFAYTQLYPWHLESACEWLESKGRLEKLATPFKLTTKSRIDVEEPAYFYDA